MNGCGFIFWLLWDESDWLEWGRMDCLISFNSRKTSLTSLFSKCRMTGLFSYLIRPPLSRILIFMASSSFFWMTELIDSATWLTIPASVMAL